MSDQNNQKPEVGAFAEEEANRKRQKKEDSRLQINQAVDQARRLIINGQVEDANRLVYEKMTSKIKEKVFLEDSIELLPAYFVMAEANICLGGTRLKKAEEFLIAGFWNLLKFTSEENEKGGAPSDSLVSKKELDQYRACLHKTFGRLFLAKNKPETQEKAKKELSQGIYLECIEHGPESIYLCSSYYYMGELFRLGKEQDSLMKAKGYYFKIAQIWKKFIMEKDLQNMQNPMYTIIDNYYYQEAIQHLAMIKQFFESQFGDDNILTAEAYLSFALVCLKTGNYRDCIQDLQKSFEIFTNQLGEFDFKTKEVEILLGSMNQIQQN